MVADRSGKSHPPRVRACHHRRCTEAEFEVSTDSGRVVVVVVAAAAAAVAGEGEAEKRDERGGKYEGLRGEWSHHRQDHIVVAG